MEVVAEEAQNSFGVCASWPGRGDQYPRDVLDIENNASRGNHQMPALQARQIPGVCKKISQVEVLSNREEHRQGGVVPALVFQLVPLACFHGFGRIYRCNPDLLVNDRP
jgi:hypothetical protein